MAEVIEQIPPLPKGGEACLRQAKRLPVRCTQTGGRQGGFRPAGEYFCEERGIQ